MKIAHCMTWNMARKLTTGENMTLTLQDVAYGEKHLKTWKMRNVHNTNWNMARKLKNLENEKYTLQDLKRGEKK